MITSGATAAVELVDSPPPKASGGEAARPWTLTLKESAVGS